MKSMSKAVPVSAHSSADEAIPALLAEHGGKIYGLGLRLCAGPDEAEDLVQETFLQAFRHWDSFEGRSQPSTWLYTIASRLCRRMHRKRSGEPEHMESLESLLPGADEAVPAPPDQEDPEYAQIRRESQERLQQALAQLPEDFRLPLVLKDLVELSGAQVAEVLGIPEATVKTRVHRARLKLRKILADGLPPTTPARPRNVLVHPSAQACLDLLQAKQEALDRGVDLPVPQQEICSRCQAVFATLDLARDVCRDLSEGPLPEEIRERLMDEMAA